MKLKRLNIIIPVLLLSLSASAAPIDDAKRLYREGDYAGAVDKLRKILKTKPKDGTANYYLGLSLIELGDYAAASEPLEKAEARGVADASRILASRALDEYRVDDADTHIETWKKSLAKAKKDEPEELAAMQRRAMRMSNMLERVESIEILDLIVVDSADFFKAYRLSAAAGRILQPDAVRRIGAGNDAAELSVAYMPQNNSEILWSAADESGVYSLYGANILDDGTLDHSVALDQSLADGGNARFPFLMPDGVTLYFANDGENSLGGYDIFMTRRNENEDGAYYQAQNMGMPYNSPYDDYMLAIDETSGLGWFATDRNRIPGKVTVYVFAPSAMRVNVDTDDPRLASLARLDNIAMTRKEGVDYKSLLESRLPAASQSQSIDADPRLFALDMGGGKVYTALSDFHNERAQSAMLEALATKLSLGRKIEETEALREQYRQGDTSVSQQILDDEREIAKLRRNYRSQINNAVRLEKE